MNPRIRFGLYAFVVSSLVASVLSAQPSSDKGKGGKVVGIIVDEYNAMTLPMAPVEIVETGEVVYTDLDGKYELVLAQGSHTLKFTFPGYQEKLVSVEAKEGQVTTADIALGLEKFEEEVTVTATAIDIETRTSEAQLVERKKASAIEDNIGQQEMAQNADSNAASAMQRVTGMSVVDDQYVFIRGLGERYNNTTLNGAVLPSTEPDKRVVPLDLFPTGLLDNVQVQKTYLPDKSADFTGGLIQINPIKSPAEQRLQLSAQMGGNGQTTFQDFGTYAGGGTDWLSFDDGTRALPGIIPDERVARGNIFTDRGFSQAELQEFGRSFANVWQPRGGTAKPDQTYAALWGNSWDKFGAIVSATYQYRNQFREEDRTFYKVGGANQNELQVQNDYDFAISTNRATLGVVGNLSFEPNPNTRLTFENFWSNSSENETRAFEGFNDDIRTNIRNRRLFWNERGIFSSKVAGEHYLPSVANSRIEWRFAYSRATRDEPDMREVLYEFNPTRDAFVLADESQSGLRMFNDLTDNAYEIAVDWSVFLTQWDGLPAMIKAGPYFNTKDRDFASRRFRFNPLNTFGVDLSLPPEQLFASENIGTVFELREETRNTDAYNAGQDVVAGYGMIDLPLARSWRFIGGVRVEKSDQNVDTFDLHNPDLVGVTSGLSDTDVLPGLSLVYLLTEAMNLRFGYSHTVNRPEFRELAPFEFTDVVGGRATVGNPDLVRALIKNVDVRWEWFTGSGEVIAASVFYKDFDNPIERVVQPTAQLRTSFENALGAKNTGFELEARKNLSRSFFVAANYTFVDSNIELEEKTGQVQTSLERPLAGQSENIFNAIFEWRVPRLSFNSRLLYNYFGDRIIDVGSLGLPDILEEGRSRVDLVFFKNWSNGSAVRVSIDNLFDNEYLFSQGGERQRSFKLGRKIYFGFTWSVM